MDHPNTATNRLASRGDFLRGISSIDSITTSLGILGELMGVPIRGTTGRLLALTRIVRAVVGVATVVPVAGPEIILTAIKVMVLLVEEEGITVATRAVAAMAITPMGAIMVMPTVATMVIVPMGETTVMPTVATAGHRGTSTLLYHHFRIKVQAKGPAPKTCPLRGISLSRIHGT